MLCNPGARSLLSLSQPGNPRWFSEFPDQDPFQMPYTDDKWPKNSSECDLKNWSPRVKKKVIFGELKTASFFTFHPVQIYSKYILQKIDQKPYSSSRQWAIYTPLYDHTSWSCHRQLDDWHKFPMSKYRNHLVGQLTRNARENLCPYTYYELIFGGQVVQWKVSPRWWEISLFMFGDDPNLSIMDLKGWIEMAGLLFW